MGAGNSNGTSMRLGSTSYDICSGCFDGKPILGKPLTLPNGPSKSVLFENEVSFSFATHVGFKYNDLSKRADDLVYDPVIRMINGEPIVHFRSGSSNVKKYHLSELYDEGRYSPIFCDEDRGIEEWRKVGRDDNTVSYATPEKIIKWLVKYPQEIPCFGPDTHLDKPVTHYDYEGPIGKYGPALSMLQNRIQNVKDILVDSEHRTYDGDTVDFSKFLEGEYEGIAPRTVLAIGIENLSPDNPAKLYYNNKHSALVFDTKFYDYVKAKAKALGLSGREELEYIIRATTYHELDHSIQPHKSKRGAEIETGENLSKFFLEKAKGLEGTRRGEIYKLLSKDAKRYAEYYRKGGGKSKSKSRNLESRIEALEEEARSLGLRCDEATDYIVRNLEEEIDQYDEEIEPGKSDKGYEKVDEDDYNNQIQEEDLSEDSEAADDGGD